LRPELATAISNRSNLALFLLAQMISRFGDPITLIALAAAVFRLTGSALLTSTAVLVATVPQASVGFFGGAIADAVGHRRAMVLSDVARALFVAIIPAALSMPEYSLAAAFALAALAGLCGAIFNPARVAIVPTLAPKAQLSAVNSLIHGTDRAVEIAGAVAAGILVASVGDAAFYIDAATFGASALILSRISVSEGPARSVSASDLWSDARFGLGFLRRSRVLFPNTVVSVMAQLSLPVANGLLPVLIFRRFSGFDTALGAQRFGLAEAALAAGAIAMGALLLRRFTGGIPKGHLVLIGWAMYGALLLGIAVAPTFEVLLLMLAFLGAANVLFFVPNVTISQEATPASLRARVFGARMSLMSLSWLPTMLLAGALADHVDVSLLIGVAGAFTIVVALVATQIRAVADVP